MISQILAHDEAGGIGNNQSLPWPKLSCDMKHFRQKTIGRTVVMGRKTFESMESKALPKRKNIVISRSYLSTSLSEENPDLMFLTSDLSFTDVLDHWKKNNSDVMIIGGAEIYRQTHHLTDKIYLTKVVGSHPADTFYNPDLTGFKLMSKEEGLENEKVVCVFEEWVREIPRNFTEIMV